MNRRTRFNCAAPGQPPPTPPPSPSPAGGSRVCCSRSPLLWVPAKICQSCSVRTSCQSWGSESQDAGVSSWWAGASSTPERCVSQSEDLAATTSSKCGPRRLERGGVGSAGCGEASGLGGPQECRSASPPETRLEGSCKHTAVRGGRGRPWPRARPLPHLEGRAPTSSGWKPRGSRLQVSMVRRKFSAWRGRRVPAKPLQLDSPGAQTSSCKVPQCARRGHTACLEWFWAD